MAAYFARLFFYSREKVASGELESGTKIIDVSVLPAGLYLLVVNENKQPIVQSIDIK